MQQYQEKGEKRDLKNTQTENLAGKVEVTSQIQGISGKVPLPRAEDRAGILKENYNYYLREWVDKAIDISSEKVKEVVLPVVDLVRDKVNGKDVQNLIGEAISSAQSILVYMESKSSDSNSYVGKAFSKVKEIGLRGIDIFQKVGRPVIEKLGSCLDCYAPKILGEENYQLIKKNVIALASTLIAYAKMAIESCIAKFKKFLEEHSRSSVEKLKAGKNSTVHTPTEREDARKMLGHLDELKSKVEYFGETKGNFLSANILDKLEDRDGIFRNQPDAIRSTPRISRPVFDPFPSREAKNELEREESLKSK
ncbi:MAG TPA: hypothetical protein PKA63_14075 [Oligoflexia bacterium]|nr:hypothetical protein [Oligoflexia bacterium]HMP49791.1 hypothetical protein [Oligoflexia bacterium]